MAFKYENGKKSSSKRTFIKKWQKKTLKYKEKYRQMFYVIEKIIKDSKKRTVITQELSTSGIILFNIK